MFRIKKCYKNHTTVFAETITMNLKRVHKGIHTGNRYYFQKIHSRVNLIAQMKCVTRCCAKTTHHFERNERERFIETDIS